MVRLVKRKSLDNVAQNDPAIFNTILDMTTSSLVHVENLILLLGRKTSLERVAAFLLEMHFRSTAAGVMHLPMSRHDIADYLGLTLETVSRAISDFRRRGILKFEDTQRHIVILNVQALAKLADEPDAAA
jgi:CRP/FNR family transcriptional regulator, nitrogen fixation regulation protein